MRFRSIIPTLLLLLAVAACAESTPATTPATPTAESPNAPTTTVAEAFPVEVRGVVIDERPERIVSLSATHTEILYALGVGDRVVATDLFSNHPPAALDTEKVDSFNLSVEAVAATDPDIVLLAFDPGGVVDGLAALGIPTILFDAPADVDGALEQFAEVGAAIGVPEAATDLIADTQGRLDAIYAAAPRLDATYYWELDPTPFTLTSDTFIGRLLAPLGLVNIADEADEAGFGYLQLSPEYVIESNPDIVFLADTLFSGQSAETLAERPGWAEIDAVASGRVVELDDDIASRWGPRIVDLLQVVVGDLE